MGTSYETILISADGRIHGQRQLYRICTGLDLGSFLRFSHAKVVLTHTWILDCLFTWTWIFPRERLGILLDRDVPPMKHVVLRFLSHFFPETQLGLVEEHEFSQWKLSKFLPVKPYVLLSRVEQLAGEGVGFILTRWMANSAWALCHVSLESG